MYTPASDASLTLTSPDPSNSCEESGYAWLTQAVHRYIPASSRTSQKSLEVRDEASYIPQYLIIDYRVDFRVDFYSIIYDLIYPERACAQTCRSLSLS